LELIVRSLMTTTTTTTMTTRTTIDGTNNSGSMAVPITIPAATTTPIYTNTNTIPTRKSSLLKLKLSSNRCGKKSLAALGAWLLNLEYCSKNSNSKNSKPNSKAKMALSNDAISLVSRCSCSLESLQISNNIETESNNGDHNDHNDNNDDDFTHTGSNSFRIRYLTQPMQTISDDNDDQRTDSKTFTSMPIHDDNDSRRRKITICVDKHKNKTLKQLRMYGNPRLGGSNSRDNDDDDDDGIDDMGYLGRFVSNYLVALEELDLDSCGITDFGLAKFAAASQMQTQMQMQIPKAPPLSSTATETTMITPNNNNNNVGSSADSSPMVPTNISLRLLRLSGNNQITSRSSLSILNILDRYPMLRTITLSSSCSGKQHQQCVWKNTIHEHQIRHLFNINESGRVLLFSPWNRHQQDRHRCRNRDRQHEDYRYHLPRGGDSVPVSLWPLVLERINRRFLQGCGSIWHRKDSRMQAANGMYFLIRNKNVSMVGTTHRGRYSSRTDVATTAIGTTTAPADIKGDGNARDDSTDACPLLKSRLGDASCNQRLSQSVASKRKRGGSVKNSNKDGKQHRWRA